MILEPILDSRVVDWGEQQRAYDRALRQHLADVPDPEEYAICLPQDVRCALAAAVMRHEGCYAYPQDIALLRPLGLCDFSSDRHRGRLLTAFGMQVRKAVLAMMMGD
ncbi:hypothetical protein Saro_0619 [Novosphingobium aromaticivorans DSM 12444]|uniref:Uncharacterized protein n=1 Tax=Novosphingobium aromaticivorans (strain ATCC 700278 / DSM 12444 / CCUG 56034 / CIP 105152 / NBRC 16084 / F199) TaxID=279238 RepID=Q2GAQ7_NOVAD|nr:hypothetical protein [Novosphingobium aromaticivorans]ABD25066.1 hypothetical protein Saro_0619 [Novosphingobium aromaticivorans DSM 12444]SCY96256.1 hypothetical protein SAMN05660666_03915 [Novosphingobium aromaticivorans]